MKLARFLARVSIQSAGVPCAEPPSPDQSLLAILERLLIDPGTIESQALLKAVIAIIEYDGELSEKDFLSLSQESTRVLDQFARDRLAMKYPRTGLEEIAIKLKHVPPVH